MALFLDCNFPRYLIAIGIPQDIFMFWLFWDFYRKAYLRKSRKVTDMVHNGNTKPPDKIEWKMPKFLHNKYVLTILYLFSPNHEVFVHNRVANLFISKLKKILQWYNPILYIFNVTLYHIRWYLLVHICNSVLRLNERTIVGIKL